MRKRTPNTKTFADIIISVKVTGNWCNMLFNEKEVVGLTLLNLLNECYKYQCV